MPDASSLARRYRSSALLFWAVAAVALLACWAADVGILCLVVGVGYAAIGAVFFVLSLRQQARAAVSAAALRYGERADGLE